MKRTALTLSLLAATAAGLSSLAAPGETKLRTAPDPTQASVDRALRWLVSVQGRDGGWGQDGGETSTFRQAERLETRGNDLANTAVAALALLRAGHTPTEGEHRAAVGRAVEFLLRGVEQGPQDSLAVTRITGTQIQRKLGPYVDTFLTSMALGELDGLMPTAADNARVRRLLQRCVAKIETHQQKDGSWNAAGGWAPILATSMASRSLVTAQAKGVAVSEMAMARVDNYTRESARAMGAGGGVGTGSGRGYGRGGGVAGGMPGGVVGGVVGGVPSAGLAAPAMAASAGVPLYFNAQALEQLTRTEKDRKANAKEIRSMVDQLDRPEFVSGFGSMGGEEFFSYLNISDSLHRVGGAEFDRWNRQIKGRLVTLQNNDGTWAGHHCITGRVAVTSAAVLTMLVDRMAGDEATFRPVKATAR